MPLPQPPTAEEFQQAYDQLHEIEWRFGQLTALYAAADTGLLAHLATEAEVAAGDAAEALGLHPVATTKLLRAVTALGLLEGDGERFTMRPGFRPLFDPDSESNHAAGLRHLFMLSKAWAEHLPSLVRTGDWPRPPRTPEMAEKFVRAMRALAVGIIPRLDAALDLARHRTLLDVGGALGTYAIALCERHPSLGATVLDTPAVAPLAEKEIVAHGLADRVKAIGGDYLAPDYPAADVVLLANVIHQENRENAEKMIHHAAAAATPGTGEVVVVDYRLEDDRCSPALGALFAINMRLSGDTYTAGDFRGWMSDAGLTHVQRKDISPYKFVIIGRKA
jgi:hypothetical protein